MIDLTPEEALRLALVDGEVAACISDPTQPDDPLIWVNAAFERLTGHPASEVLGRNCRFLQGTGTDPGSLGEIGRAHV